jgi:hypothetical protein
VTARPYPADDQVQLAAEAEPEEVVVVAEADFTVDVLDWLSHLQAVGGGLSARVDLSTRESGGPVVVALRGELDAMNSAYVVAPFSAVAAPGRMVIVDLAGLKPGTPATLPSDSIAGA